MPTSEARKRLLAALRVRFYPKLRQRGFIGSGTRFTRIREPFVDCLEVQTRTQLFSACRIEVGLHVKYLPTVLGRAPDARTISVLECEFRKIISPNHPAFGWPCGETERETLETAAAIEEAFFMTAEPLLIAFDRLPGPFGLVTAENIVKDWNRLPLDGPPPSRTALYLARLYLHLGDVERAEAFARAGLAHVGLGVKLIPIFESLIESLEVLRLRGTSDN